MEEAARCDRADKTSVDIVVRSGLAEERLQRRNITLQRDRAILGVVHVFVCGEMTISMDRLCEIFEQEWYHRKHHPKCLFPIETLCRKSSACKETYLTHIKTMRLAQMRRRLRQYAFFRRKSHGRDGECCQ